MKKQPVRGTRDLLDTTFDAFHYVQAQAFQTAQKYGFKGIETPVFEFTEVFQKNLGEASDIVGKEMYSFEDRGGESITLRPEGTASVVRAMISEGMLRNIPLKYYYQGPMFRYERPQKGRYRQFFQVGVELIGAKEPTADLEVIALGYSYLNALGLNDGLKLNLNSIGDTASRKNYCNSLVAYLTPKKSKLSEDSQRRLTTNPLRILDSKSEGDIEILKNAPKLADCMNPESKEFFAAVYQGLEALNIPYHIEDKLVRGLDYYTHTVFEFTTDKLGAQGAVLSGGRYNNLVKNMGGTDCPGVGWAAGVDRLVLLLEADKREFTRKQIAVVPVSPENEMEALKLMHQWRSEGVNMEMPFSGNLSKKLKKAARHCQGAILVGGDEGKKGQLSIKNFNSGQQTTVPINDALKVLKNEGLI